MVGKKLVVPGADYSGSSIDVWTRVPTSSVDFKYGAVDGETGVFSPGITYLVTNEQFIDTKSKSVKLVSSDADSCFKYIAKYSKNGDYLGLTVTDLHEVELYDGYKYRIVIKRYDGATISDLPALLEKISVYEI